MPDFAGVLGASKAASALLVLFIPSKDRDDKAIDQEYWVDETLNALGMLFGGATVFPQGRGVWRDDDQGASSCSMSRWSFNVTPANICLNSK
ncbi:MAG: hypothetical protein NVSMB9_08190 [Isosphaeraceae bacterium]